MIVRYCKVEFQNVLMLGENDSMEELEVSEKD